MIGNRPHIDPALLPIVVTAPAVEPVTLAQAKEHLRVVVADDDALITRLITAAREEVETISRRALVTQTLRGAMASWPADDSFPLMRPPLQSVTKIDYTNYAGATVTLDAGQYVVDTLTTPGRVWLGYGKSWPTVALQPGNSIVVDYVAGYGDLAADVPAKYAQALLLILGDYYENRERTSLMPGLTAATLQAVDDILYSSRGWV